MISTVLPPARLASSVALAAALEAAEPRRKSPASTPNLLRLDLPQLVCLPSDTPLRLSLPVAVSALSL